MSQAAEGKEKKETSERNHWIYGRIMEFQEDIYSKVTLVFYEYEQKGKGFPFLQEEKRTAVILRRNLLEIYHQCESSVEVTAYFCVLFEYLLKHPEFPSDVANDERIYYVSKMLKSVLKPSILMNPEDELLADMVMGNIIMDFTKIYSSLLQSFVPL
jgi:hypothetical protein